MTVTRDSRVTYPPLSRVSHGTPSRPVPTRPKFVVRTACGSLITSDSKTKFCTSTRFGFGR